MKYVYAALSVLSLIFGLFVFLQAKSSIHEIEALIAILICAVFAVAAEVAELREKLKPQIQAAEMPPVTGERAITESDIDALTKRLERSS